MNIIRRIKTQGVFILPFILFICIKRNMLFNIRRNYHRSAGMAKGGGKRLSMSMSGCGWYRMMYAIIS